MILALDTDDLEEARAVASSLAGLVDVVKVGLELFTCAGPEAVSTLRKDGFEVFLDVKYSDIPNTVARSCIAACNLEPLFITLHAMGGQEMMRAAARMVREHCSAHGLRRPLLTGVTVLTSLDLLALKKIGIRGPVEDEVMRLALLARDSGMDGLVTSPMETRAVRNEVGDDFIIITPGIRPEGAAGHDQARLATPARAMEAGSSFLVVGRPVFRAADPRAAAMAILEEVGNFR